MGTYIKRDCYLEQLKPFIGTNVIKILTGMRRTGKSVMLELIRDELSLQGVSADRFITLNFEDSAYAQLREPAALEAYVVEHMSRNGKEAGTFYLFFDEIQEVASWESCINSLRATRDVDIYITGSNSHLLSGELATFLSGRYITCTIYPFSFAEYLSLRAARRKETEQDSEPLSAGFNAYLQQGGMPFVVDLDMPQSARQRYLNDLFDSVILKDIVRRNNVRSVDQLQRICDFALANVGKTFSATSISNYFINERRPIATETVINYLRYCTEAYLLYKANREDLIGKRVLSVNEKYYCIDHALRDAVTNSSNRNIAQTLENVVYLELLRRGYEVSVGKAHDLEVDFVARCGGERHYIQVAYLLTTPETIEREERVFAQIPDHYPRHLISLDEIDMSANGIRHHYLPQFLLDESW
ncbi:MAG: ATP-binding protein [Coriobacteriales bacterium]|nr:ATP-binding protein [Coriobacteriales bacterium]